MKIDLSWHGICIFSIYNAQSPQNGKKRVKTIFKLLYSVLVIVLGFVSAALITTISSFKKERIGEVALIDHPHKSLSGFALLMFTGPYLLAKNGISLWHKESVSKGLVMFCFLLAFLWSFFQGVIFSQVLVFSGLITNPGI